MDILFISAHIPHFLVKRSGGKLDSLYRSTESLINSLKGVEGVSLKVITSPDIIRYPKGPFYLKREENTEEDVTLVGNLNLPIIRFVWSICNMVREASNYLRKKEGKVVVVIPYIVYRHVATLRILKFLFPKKVVQAAIVPDIFFPKGSLSKIMNKQTESMASKFDCFVLYTEAMAEHLNLEDGCYIVNEGFVKLSDRQRRQGDVFNVVYTGSLNLRYGLGRLLDAMKYVKDPEVELHLYGSGDAAPMAVEAAKKDRRIKYFGLVNKEAAMDAIYSAAVLVNPRNSKDGDYTKYSFPSKDIDYLATGIPTLLCKLPGMPKEYYDHFIDIKEATPHQIAEGIFAVKNMSIEERDTKGKSARNFIFERMNTQRQAKGIIELFSKVMIK